jgi:hypothetical protein
MDRQGGTAPDTDEALVSVGAGHEPVDAAEEWAAAQAAARPRAARPRPDHLQEPAGSQDAAPAQEWTEYAPDEPIGEFQAPTLVPSDAGSDPGRFTEDGASSIPDEIDEQEWADHVAAAPAPAPFAAVDAEQLRPVPHRPGRGGFDPEAAEATRAYRYQQRRRVALILLVATVAFSVAAPLVTTWLWFGAAVSAALLIGYLTYLRRQVKIEAAIRQRRMERLQRARQIRPEYARPPQRTRGGMSAVAPGRAVVDLDDDDPAFADLEDYQPPMTYRRAAGQ